MRFLLRSRVKYLLALSLLSSSFLLSALLPSSSAHASSVYDNIVHNATTPFKVYNPDFGSGLSYASSYDLGIYLGGLTKSYITSSASGNCGYAGGTYTDDIYNAIQNIKDGKPYLLLQYTDTYGRKSIGYFVQSSPTATHIWHWYSSGYLYLESSTPTFTFFTQSIRTSGSDSFCWQANNFSSANVNGPGGTNTFIESSVPLTYPDGYAGDSLNVVEPSSYPKFGYTVNSDKLLSISYLNNLNIANPSLNNGYKFHYQLYKANEDYTPNGDAIDSQYPPSMMFPYQYQITDLGKYVVTIDLQVTPPAAPRNDIHRVTIKLDVNGKFFGGNTGSCEGGVCEPPSSDCDLYLGALERMTCTFEKNTDMGIINPSLTAVKNLVSALVVPDNPTCSIPLSNITIMAHVFPSSTLGAKACSSSDTIRSSFPIITIITNFIFALSIFYLIGRTINKLTDNTKNDIVEGV